MSHSAYPKVTRPASRWYGGKWVLGKWVASHFPEHKIYVEPFSGMWSVGLQKHQSEVEVYNDLHKDAVNFFAELRDNSEELIGLIESVQFGEELYNWARQPGGTTLEQAVKFYAQCSLSYTGGGVIAPGTSTVRLKRSEYQKPSHLRAIAHRISNLHIFNKDALEIIKQFDSPNTLFYCDPCYLPEVRTSPRRYIHDLTTEQHRKLAELLNEIEGHAVISGYPSSVYNSLYSGWEKHSKKTSANTTHKKTDECLWVKKSPPVHKILFSSESNEWYTPKDITDRARKVMGTIGLDPASNEFAQEWVKADEWYGLDHPQEFRRDGYQASWPRDCQSIWLNPPYGKVDLKKDSPNYGASAWIWKAIEHYQENPECQMHILCRGDSSAVRWLDKHAIAVIPNERIKFLDGKTVSVSTPRSPPPGVKIYSLGTDWDLFYEVWKDFGAIRIPYRTRSECQVASTNTGIEWTDKTWNPTTGCDKISPGCTHCYAEALTKRFHTNFRNGFALTVHENRLTQPKRWRKPSRIFVNSMSDLFHEEVPQWFLKEVFDVMSETPWHIYQILTKRHERLLELASTINWPKNVWMGVSVENKNYIHRLDYLREVPSAVRFLSCEPLLGPLQLDLTGIDWVIVGGESGPKYRPIRLDWVREIRDRCQDAGVAFFFKQVGGTTPKAGGRLLDGRIWDQMPEAWEQHQTSYNKKNQCHPHKSEQKMPKPLTAATLFSGFGLADVGLEQAGFKVVGAVEKNPDIAEWHQINHPQCKMMVGSVEEFNYHQFLGIDLLHMSPPCQQYSQARSSNLSRHEGADAGLLALKAIDQTLPKFITLENVPGYLRSDSYSQIKEHLWELGYYLKEDILNAADYGVPQSRRRLFAQWIRADVIQRGEVPNLCLAESLFGGEKYWLGADPPRRAIRKSWYSAISDLLPSLPETKLARWQIEKLPKNISSHLLIGDQNGMIHTDKELAFTICANSRFHALLFYRDGHRGEELRVFLPEEPAPTIKAMGHSGHSRQLDGWDGERELVVKITPRALARFQSVPDSFQLPPKPALACIGIGNGVPCEMMRQIAAGLITEKSLGEDFAQSLTIAQIPKHTVLQQKGKAMDTITAVEAVEVLNEDIPLSDGTTKPKPFDSLDQNPTITLEDLNSLDEYSPIAEPYLPQEQADDDLTFSQIQEKIAAVNQEIEKFSEIVRLRKEEAFRLQGQAKNKLHSDFETKLKELQALVHKAEEFDLADLFCSEIHNLHSSIYPNHHEPVGDGDDEPTAFFDEEAEAKILKEQSLTAPEPAPNALTFISDSTLREDMAAPEPQNDPGHISASLQENDWARCTASSAKTGKDYGLYKDFQITLKIGGSLKPCGSSEEIYSRDESQVWAVCIIENPSKTKTKAWFVNTEKLFRDRFSLDENWHVSQAKNAIDNLLAKREKDHAEDEARRSAQEFEKVKSDLPLFQSPQEEQWYYQIEDDTEKSFFCTNFNFQQSLPPYPETLKMRLSHESKLRLETLCQQLSRTGVITGFTIYDREDKFKKMSSPKESKVEASLTFTNLEAFKTISELALDLENDSSQEKSTLTAGASSSSETEPAELLSKIFDFENTKKASSWENWFTLIADDKHLNRKVQVSRSPRSSSVHLNGLTKEEMKILEHLHLPEETPPPLDAQKIWDEAIASSQNAEPTDEEDFRF